MANEIERNEILDEAGRTICRSARATDDELAQAMASPFLFAKIRARIAQGNPTTARPTSIFLIWRQAIPALLLVAMIATVSFLVAPKKAAPVVANPPDILQPASDPKFQLINNPTGAPITACSIASKEECAVSTRDVVAILMNTSEGQNRNE
ncbi:MAG: hypothetical protein AB1757_07940 [Acidobacteriota bacterium]